MYYLYIAYQVLDDTRMLLKPSMKSGNKKYEPTLAQKLKLKATAKEEEVAKKERQWDHRNWCQEWVDARFNSGYRAVVDVSGLTVLEAGEAMYNRAVRDITTWYGNCGEQALIALYLCAREGVDPKNLFLRTYEKQDKKGRCFAHSFVLLDAGRSRTMASGRTYRAAPPSRQRDVPQAVCCDPWLGIACNYSEYSDKADDQLREWTKKGKRLSYGVDGWGRTNWVEPSNKKILGFARVYDKVEEYNAYDKPKPAR